MDIKRTTGSVADISRQESYLSNANTEVAGLDVCRDEKLSPPNNKTREHLFL